MKQSPSIPPPSIWHIMLWTFCAAAFIAVKRFAASSGELPNTPDAVASTVSICNSILYGAMVAGALILLLSRRSALLSRIEETQPGHWLLMFDASVSVVWPLIDMFINWAIEQFAPYASIMLLLSGIYILLVTMNVVATVFVSGIRWKVFFFARASVNLLQAGMYAIAASQYYGTYTFTLPWQLASSCYFAVAFIAIVVAVIDLAVGMRRDWLHWLGLTAYLAATSVSIHWLLRSLA